MIGTKLAHYEITSHLGSGGMGEVYQATDTKLGRDVAIKMLPDAFTRDNERVARFQREARVLASLNHPHIAAIYGMEQSGERKFLIMELAAGETLAQRISHGAIPMDEALEIAKQIADALSAAHEKGIVHRDLKPANVKIAADGNVKVLDFGLAKAFDTDKGKGPASDSPTLSLAATNAGVILGTASYMSPEQAKGREVDRRTDIFAFGCLLYEMLTGRPAFDGDDVAEILGAVLKTEPDWKHLPNDVPQPIRKLLKLCLEKNPRNRRSDAADIRIDIEQSLQEPQSVPAPPPASTTNARLPWMVAIVMSIAFASVAVLYFLRTPMELPELRVEITTPSTTSPADFALSPDGRSLVFVASGDGPQRLWLRHLDKAEAQPLAGTEDASYPFWSSDGRSIGFFADGKLKRCDIDGGSSRTLANVMSGRGGTWNADGTIIFSPSLSAVLRLSSTGGEPSLITHFEPGQLSQTVPDFLPDGRHFLFFAQGGTNVQGIYLASMDGSMPKRLIAADSGGQFLKPDRIVFVQQGALVARRIDLKSIELVGNTEVLADSIAVDPGYKGAFSVSASGAIAYRGGAGASRQLKWYDRSGKAAGVPGEPDTNDLRAPELSHDGRRVLLDRTVLGNRDIWVMDLVRSRLDRLTFDQSGDGYPIWSPDGTQIAFESNRKGHFDLYVKPASAFGNEEQIHESPNNKWPLDWSKNGQFLLFHEADPKNRADLWALPRTGNERKPVVVANSTAEERNGQFSPDGQWVAYETNESGTFQIFVQPFPRPSGKRQVSAAGGNYPRWRADGKELYFISPDGKLMAAMVQFSESSFESETPVPLFQTRILGGNLSKHQYAVSADGRFLINEVLNDSSAGPITLILNRKSAN